MDAFSRAIVGWSTSDVTKLELVERALQMAIDRRRPAIGSGLVHHSDSEYVGAGVPGVLTLTAMDATGCRCQVAPGRPDPHSDGRSLPGYVGRPGAPGEAPRLAEGVT